MEPNVERRRRGDAMREDHSRILARLTAGGMHPDRVVSKDELAALSNLHVRTIDRLLETGEGPTKVVLSPGRMGFLLRDVHRWLDSRRQSSCMALGT